MSAVQIRRDGQEKVAEAQRVLDLLHVEKALRPPLGPAAEVSLLERLIEAHTALGNSYLAAAPGYRSGSLPHTAMVDQHRTTALYVTRLRAELVAKQAEVARLRGER